MEDSPGDNRTFSRLLSSETLACPLGLCPYCSVVSLNCPLSSDIQPEHHLRDIILALPLPPPCFSGILLAPGSAATERCRACWPVFSSGAGATTHLCPPPAPSQCLAQFGHPGKHSRNADVAPLLCGAAQWRTARAADPRDLFPLPEDTFCVPRLP